MLVLFLGMSNDDLMKYDDTRLAIRSNRTCFDNQGEVTLIKIVRLGQSSSLPEML